VGHLRKRAMPKVGGLILPTLLDRMVMVTPPQTALRPLRIMAYGPDERPSGHWLYGTKLEKFVVSCVGVVLQHGCSMLAGSVKLLTELLTRLGGVCPSQNKWVCPSQKGVSR
jgi:hypothetical protein